MDRAYSSGAAGSAPSAPASPSLGYPSAGNPGTGTPATKPGAYWYHMVMEELLAVIAAAGITPDQTKLTQLASAIQSGKLFSAAAGGTADAITASFSPAITTLFNGMALYIRAAAANATTTPTFTPNSGTVAAKQIVKGAGAALVAGDIAGAGHWVELQYDLTLDKWVLHNPATGVATVTAVNDPYFSSSDGRPASASWVRGAFSAIATAAGFAYSFIATGGYIKFPSWLAGWVVQWGFATSGSGGNTTITFPIAFPTQLMRALVTNPVGNVNNGVSGGSVTNFTTGSYQADIGTPLVGVAIPWIAIGN